MTYGELKKHLAETVLFSDDEIQKIIQVCGVASLGHAVIACEILGIQLTGHDVNDIFDQT